VAQGTFGDRCVGGGRDHVEPDVERLGRQKGARSSALLELHRIDVDGVLAGVGG